MNSEPSSPSAPDAPAPRAMSRREILGYAALALVLLLSVAAVNLVGSVATSEQFPVKFPLPENIGSWTSREIEVTKAERDILPADTAISKRLYTDPLGRSIFVTLIISGKEGRSIHRPEYCLPGQGWTITSSEETRLQTQIRNSPLEVRKLVLERVVKTPSGQTFKPQLLNLYWFEDVNHTTSSHAARTWRMTWDKIFHRRNNRWAFLTVFSEVSASTQPFGQTQTQTLQFMDQFLQLLRPAIDIDPGTGTKAR